MSCVLREVHVRRSCPAPHDKWATPAGGICAVCYLSGPIIAAIAAETRSAVAPLSRVLMLYKPNQSNRTIDTTLMNIDVYDNE